MTKIYLQDANIKKIMLEQYHPYVSINLWNLQQEELEQFAQISEETLYLDDIFVIINTKDITNATLIIYNHDYDNNDSILIDDYLLFQKNINQSEQTHIIRVHDLNEERLRELNNEDIITIKLYDLDETIYTRDCKIIFNEEKTSFSCLAENTINDYVNLKIIEKDIEQLLYQTDNSEYMLNHYKKYISTPDDSFNGNYDNIIFTPEKDWKTIIPFEYYKGAFYLRLPYFCHTICLHIIPKYYNTMDNVALFTTDDMIEYLQNNPPEYAWLSERNIEDKINTTAEDGQVARYLIDLPQECKEMSSIQIDAFYLYTDDNCGFTNNLGMTNVKNNQIGIIDTKIRGYSDVSSETEDQKTLISNNLDLLNNDSHSTNQITQLRRNHNSIILMPLTSPAAFEYESGLYSSHYFALQEAHKKDTIYETTIKYFNDDIYVEEYNPRIENAEVDRVNELKTNNQYNYMTQEWSE